MWLQLIIYYIFFMFLTTLVDGHIPEYMSTPPNKVDQYCNLAETCVHDTIRVCGKYNEKSKTFLDMCDLLEYVCDTGDVYKHAPDEPNCPAPEPERET